jgi:hypothetical protein
MEKLRTHAERKSEIIERLKVKVDLLKEILAKEDELFSMNGEEALAMLDEQKERLVEYIPEEINVKIDHYNVLVTEWEEIDKRRTAIEEVEDGRGSEEYEALGSRLDEVMAEVERLMEDEEAQFYIKLLNGFNSLKEKILMVENSQAVDLLKESYQKIGIEDGVFEPKEEDFILIRKEGPSILLVVKDSEWSMYNEGDDADGFFRGETPFIFIKESVYNSEDSESTIAHERKHLLLDGVITSFISNRNNPAEVANKFLDRNLTFIAERALEIITRKGFVGRAINSLHNEFLAEYKNALESDFGEWKISKREQLFMMFNDSLNKNTVLTEVKRSARSLSTAGNYVKGLLISLSKLTNNLQQHGMSKEAEEIKDVSNQFMMRFAHIMRSVRDSGKFACATNSDEALEDMNALVHILEPNKFEHILSYLESQYREAEHVDDDFEDYTTEDDFKIKGRD